jgi:hypothetical protein
MESTPAINQVSMMDEFSTPAPVAAVVDVPAGRIRFTAAAQEVTTVQVAPADPSKGRDVKLAAQITATYADGVLRVQGPAGNRYFGSTGAVQLTVQLPSGSHVEAKAASAELVTEGPLGDVSFTGSQGPVSIGHATTARVAIADGDVSIGRLDGDADLRTVRGNVMVSEAAGGTVVLRTEAGSIEVGTAAGVSAFLDASTVTGRIANALMNSGGTPALAIRATAVTGDITARSL